MDGARETGQGFKLLPKDIANISMEDLVQKVHKDVPTGPNPKVVFLQAFMAWLHGRLSVIDNSDEAIFNKEVDSWYRFLTEFGFEGETIADGFQEWKAYQSVAEPSSLRRLDFAGMRISHLFSQSAAPEGATSRNTATTQPDRALLAFEEADPGDEEPAAEDDESLSFLTGANAMVHGRSSDPRGSLVAQHTASQPPKTKTERIKITSKYICNRCGGRGMFSRSLTKAHADADQHTQGHAIADCPTNLDPDYDLLPYPDYVCKICGAKSQHYVTLCPQNTDPDSINQQRIRHDKEFGRTDERHGRGRRGRYSPDHGPAHQRLHSPERYSWDDEPPRYRGEYTMPSGRRDWSPQPNDRYPRRDTCSPRRRSRSPRPNHPSPHPRARSPRRTQPSPHPQPRSPRRNHPSPHPRAWSPRRNRPSPHSRDWSPRRNHPSPHSRARSPRRNNPSPHPHNRDYYRLTRDHPRDHPRRRSISPLPRARHPRHFSPRPSNRSSRTPARQEEYAHSVYGESRNTGGRMSSAPTKSRDISLALSDHLSGSLTFHDHGAEPSSDPEEGETFSDEADDQAENSDNWALVQPEQLSEALDDLISEMSDIWLPEKDPIYEEPVIEFGVTPKSLNCEPAYHPKILRLFRDRPNVWMHRVKRDPAWVLWTDVGATKIHAKADTDVDMAPATTSTGEALDENMDLESALPQDDSSIMQQEETGPTENQLQISNPGEVPGEDRDVVMEDAGSTEELTCALPGPSASQDDNTTTAFTGHGGETQANRQRATQERLRELEEEMAKAKAKLSQLTEGGTDQ